MRTFRAELHVHTVLSPCAEVEMIPPLIVEEALDAGIQILAITDHNASANVWAVQKAAAGSGLAVLPGMEVQTVEEVHVLCLFETLAQLSAWQEQVDEALPDIKNNIEFFGEQFVVDETGDFIRREERLLITSTQLSLEGVISAVHRLEGLAIPAHIDRRAFGLIANLGFVPPGLPADALEISHRTDPRSAQQLAPGVSAYTLIQSGDVHRLEEMLGNTYFNMETPTFKEMRMALHGQQGRSVQIIPVVG